jgi:hypothetical protein
VATVFLGGLTGSNDSWAQTTPRYSPSTAVGDSEQSGAESSETTITKQTVFSIPFYLNPKAAAPRNVFLFVSHDQGKSWTLYQRREPHEQKFVFQASQDGEFWFVVRTDLDQRRPDTETRPEKIVVIDRSPPELEFQVSQGDTGELFAEWNARDPRLDPRSLRVEYRSSMEEKWQAVPLPPRDPRHSTEHTQELFSGRATWALSQQEGSVLVRALVLDQAGNSQIVERSLSLPPPVRRLAPATRGDDQPPWGQPRSQLEDPARPFSSDHPIADAVGPGGQDAPDIPTLPKATPSTTSELPDWHRPEPPSGLAPLPKAQDKTASIPERELLEAKPPFEWDRADNWTTSSAPQTSPSSQDIATQSRSEWSSERFEALEPAVGSRFDEPHSSTRSTEPNLANGQESPRPRAMDSLTGPVPREPDRDIFPIQHFPVTNSRTFELEYDVADLGTGHVSRVVLWYTLDNGSHWQMYGTDPDNKSPFLVEVDGEGVYGFRLLVYDDLGQSGRIPQPGDAPDQSVRIDVTPPQAKLVNVDVKDESGRIRVLISWTASDETLTDRPIQLFAAPTLDGPWLEITEQLPNDGMFTWEPSQRLSAQTYLQLRVTDRAGNTATHELPQPIGRLGREPVGVIRGLRPVPPKP